jgi:hypothetical protein
MRRLWQAISWRTLRRRLCAAVTLLGYLLATFGVPLPATARKAEDLPFPCRDHPCGCLTAEQCWTACCCFTPEQRWAWARQHHVEPPAFAEKPSGHSWRTTRLRDREAVPAKQPTRCSNCPAHGGTQEKRPEPAKPCCSPRQGHPPCCQQPQPTPARTKASCCQKPPSGPSCKPSTTSQEREGKSAGKGTMRWGLGVAALRCQGVNTLWATTGAALPAGPPLTWTLWQPAVTWLSYPPESPLGLPPSPPEPPPRALSA